MAKTENDASGTTIVDVTVEGSKGSLLNTYAAIPDFFYDVQTEVTPIASSVSRVRVFATMLYLVSTFVLFGSFGYYYMPEQRNSEVSTVTSDWQKDGHICKPLQKTIIEGLSTDWSYDECIASVSRPNTVNVVTVEKSDNSSQFDYRFATQGNSSGSISFWDVWNGNVFSSYEWQNEGFMCKPLQPISVGGLSTDWSYDECMQQVIHPDTDSVSAVIKSSDGDAEHHDYVFAQKDGFKGTLSFYDQRYESSIFQIE